MHISGYSYTILGTPVIQVFMLAFLMAATALWVSLNSFSTTSVSGVICSVSAPGNSGPSSGLWFYPSYLTTPEFFSSSSFSQSKIYLFLLLISVPLPYLSFILFYFSYILSLWSGMTQSWEWYFFSSKLFLSSCKTPSVPLVCFR